RAMQRREEEVTRPVAREHAARTVAAVRGRRQTDEEKTRAWVAETGNRPRPIRVVAVGRPFVARDGLAPRDEARARPAYRDLLRERAQIVRTRQRHECESYCRTPGTIS